MGMIVPCQYENSWQSKMSTPPLINQSICIPILISFPAVCDSSFGGSSNGCLRVLGPRKQLWAPEVPTVHCLKTNLDSVDLVGGLNCMLDSCSFVDSVESVRVGPMGIESATCHEIIPLDTTNIPDTEHNLKSGSLSSWKYLLCCVSVARRAKTN